jgi:hypothetical protein
MYLVELRPGKEEVYRTVDELGAAIRRGEVTWQSRIYHKAASTWISITLHPHFKRIAGERRSDPPQRLPKADWTFLRAPSPPEKLRSELELRQHGTPNGSRTESSAKRTKAAKGWRAMFGGLVGNL